MSYWCDVWWYGVAGCCVPVLWCGVIWWYWLVYRLVYPSGVVVWWSWLLCPCGVVAWWCWLVYPSGVVCGAMVVLSHRWLLCLAEVVFLDADAVDVVTTLHLITYAFW